MSKVRYVLSHTRKPRRAPANRGCESAIHVRAYDPASWYTSQGVRRKRREIERRGMPSMDRWRFTTTTVCRKRFCGDPLAAYLRGKDRMRAFLERLRVLEIIERGTRWAWKLEFHEDGFPHWHLMIDRKKKLTVKEMAAMTKAWGLGRVHNEMISERRGAFMYTMKYAFKPVMVEGEQGELGPDDEGGAYCVPQWFADYCASKTVRIEYELEGELVSERVTKPVTFARVRFWQTSKGFYTHHKPKPAQPKERPAQVTWTIPLPVGQIIAANGRRIQVIARKWSGRYISGCIVPLKCSLQQFWNRVCYDSIQGGAVGLAIGSYIVPTNLTKQLIQCTTKLTVCYLQNSMTLRLAAGLLRSGETLRTC